MTFQVSVGWPEAGAANDLHEVWLGEAPDEASATALALNPRSALAAKFKVGMVTVVRDQDERVTQAFLLRGRPATPTAMTQIDSEVIVGLKRLLKDSPDGYDFHDLMKGAPKWPGPGFKTPTVQDGWWDGPGGRVTQTVSRLFEDHDRRSLVRALCALGRIAQKQRWEQGDDAGTSALTLTEAWTRGEADRAQVESAAQDCDQLKGDALTSVQRNWLALCADFARSAWAVRSPLLGINSTLYMFSNRNHGRDSEATNRRVQSLAVQALQEHVPLASVLLAAYVYGKLPKIVA